MVMRELIIIIGLETIKEKTKKFSNILEMKINILIIGIKKIKFALIKYLKNIKNLCQKLKKVTKSI